MLTKEEFVKTHPDVRMGMTVYSMDGEKLGVIERIDEDNLMIERGWFFHKDYTISYDDIENIRGDRVLVRVRRADLEEERPEETEFTGRTGGRAAYGREEELQTEKQAEESEVGIRREARPETERLEVPVQEEDVIVERTPAKESWTSETDEKTLQEEERVEPPKPTQKE